MRVDVAFTPAEAARVPIGIAVDVLRATSTIVQALEAGYRRVLCCGDVREARALCAEVGDAVLAGERDGRAVSGFDLGNSPREFLEPRATSVVLTTTNGTRGIVAAASTCDVVFVGSLLNLDAVAGAARAQGEDVTVLCAGVDGSFALDDAYCAGRIVETIGARRSDAAEAALRIARSFGSAEEALRAGGNARQADLGDDVSWCARENVSAIVPHLVGMRGRAAEIESAP